MLPVFFSGALGLYRPAIVVGTVFCLHALAEIALAPFGLIFYFDEAGKYIRGAYYIVYELAYLLSLVFLVVSMIIVSMRFKKRDLSTLIMAFACYGVFNMIKDKIVADERTATLLIPYWPFYVIELIAFVVLTLALLGDTIKSIAAIFNKKAAEDVMSSWT